MSDLIWIVANHPVIIVLVLMVALPWLMLKYGPGFPLSEGLNTIVSAQVLFVSGWILVGAKLRIGGSARKGVFWAVVLYLLIGVAVGSYSLDKIGVKDSLLSGLFWPLILLIRLPFSPL